MQASLQERVSISSGRVKRQLCILLFLRPSILCSTAAAPIYTPTNSTKVFLSLHTLVNLTLKKKLTSLFLARGLSSSGARAELSRSTRNLPGPGIKPVSSCAGKRILIH